MRRSNIYLVSGNENCLEYYPHSRYFIANNLDDLLSMIKEYRTFNKNTLVVEKIEVVDNAIIKE